MDLIAFLIAILVVGLLVTDCRQTLNIKLHPEVFETNEFLGPHPTDKTIYAYFLFCAVLFCALFLVVLPRWSLIAQGLWAAGWIAVEVKVIFQNKKLGL